MTNSNSKSGPPDSSDPLSATGMFLRAFEQDTKKDAPPEDPFGFETARPASTTPAPQPPVPAAPASSASGPGPGAPGEFTQMFNTMGQRPASPAPVMPPPPQVRGPREEVFPRGVEASTQVVKGPPQPPPANVSSGEFTRILVSGVTPAYTPPARPSEETPRPVPPPSAQTGAKGEGGFTQFFSTNAARPATPAPAPVPPPRPVAASPAADTSWKDDPFFQPAQKKPSVPDAPSSSVTGILSSLAGSGAGTAAPKAPEPAPYRPEPLPSHAPPKPAAEEPGGVTRLIKRLSQEQAAPAPPPQSAAPPPPPADSGPGEFTRIIQGLGPRSAAPAPPPPPAPAPAAPMFSVAPPAIPPVPHIAPPPMPAAPHMPAAHAPAPAPAPAPVFVAPVLPPPPAIPKPPAPALPALAPPKGKLEAMVPILLVINTFLLVLLLVVVIFLIKAK